MTIKIKSFKKGKNNSYTVDFVGNQESVVLYDEVILKNNLLIKKEIDTELLKKMLLENASLDCYYKGLNYLNYKRRSKKEIENYLEKSGFLKKDIYTSIERLEKEGFINEKQYLEAFINDQIHLTNHGPLKIIQKLKLLGFQETEIRNYLETFSSAVWQEKIAFIVNKKIKSNRHLGNIKLKEKLLFSLISEGFKKEEILEVLDKINFVSKPSILKKEAEKYYIKLSRKYEGTALKYQLRMKLLSRGFENTAVDGVVEEFFA